MGLIKVNFEVTESFRNLENIKAEAQAEKGGKQNAYSLTLTTTCVPAAGWTPTHKMEIKEIFKLTATAKSVM